MDTDTQAGRVPTAPGSHASHEARSGLRPSGFDPSRESREIDTECTPPLSLEMIAEIQRVAEKYQRQQSAIPAIERRPGESNWEAIQRHLRDGQVDRWAEFNLRLQLIRGINLQAVGAAISNGRMHDVETAYNGLRDMIDALIADGMRR